MEKELRKLLREEIRRMLKEVETNKLSPTDKHIKAMEAGYSEIEADRYASGKLNLKFPKPKTQSSLKEVEETSDEDILTQLRKSMKPYITGNKGPVDVKIIDKRKGHNGEEKTITMGQDESGNIKVMEVDEAIKDKLMVGIVCTILASGLVSCTKDTGGVGYNFGAHRTTYDISNQKNPNSKIKISSIDSDEKTYDVDSASGKLDRFGTSAGGKFKRAMSPTEAEIMKAGRAYQVEKQANTSKRLTPKNLVYDFNPEDVDIEMNMYNDEATDFNDCRSHPLWNMGLEALKNDGVDTNALIRKADQEVEKGIKYTK